MRPPGKREFRTANRSETADNVITSYSIHYTKLYDGGDQSFPSGHASISFAGATFLQKRYGWRYGIPAFLAAAFVGYSRVESDEHWTKDVLGGAAIGIASGWIFTSRFRNNFV